MSAQENVLSQPAAASDTRQGSVDSSGSSSSSASEVSERGDPALRVNTALRIGHTPIIDSTQVIAKTIVDGNLGDRWVAPISFGPLARIVQGWPERHIIKTIDWVKTPKAYTSPMDRALPVIQADAPAAPFKCTACQRMGLFTVCTVHPEYSRSGACTSCILLHNPSGCSHYVAPAAKDPLERSLALVDDPEQLGLLLQDHLNRLGLYLAHQEGGVPVWPVMPPVRQRRILLRRWAAHDGFAVVPQATYDQMKDRLAKIRYKYIQKQIRDDETILLPKGTTASAGARADKASMGPLGSKKRGMEASGLDPVGGASLKKKLKGKQPLSSATMPVEGGSESESDSAAEGASGAAQTLLSAFTASSNQIAAAAGPSALGPDVVSGSTILQDVQAAAGGEGQGQESTASGKAPGVERERVVEAEGVSVSAVVNLMQSKRIPPAVVDPAATTPLHQEAASQMPANESNSGVDEQGEELPDRVVLPLPSVKPGWLEKLSGMMQDAQLVCSETWLTAGNYPISISPDDIAILNDPAGWLNDTIIAGYCRMLCKVVNDGARARAVVWVDPSLTSALCRDIQRAQSMDGYASICHEVDQAGMVVLPVHDSGREHWLLVVAVPERREAWVFDSFRYYEKNELDVLLPFMSPILNWLNQVHVGLKGVDLGGWTVHPNVSPLQDNTDDCGIFVCASLRYLVCRRDASRPLPYSQTDIPAFRAHLKCELVLGSLERSVLPEDPVVYRGPSEFVRESPTVRDYLHKHKKESRQSLLDSIAVEDEVSGGDPSAGAAAEAASQN